VKPWVHDWVAYHAARRPEAPALTSIERGVTVTWSQLEDRVARLADLLRHEFALAPGDRVAMVAENDIRVIELQFACMRAEAIFTPLSWRLAMGEMITLARDSTPKLLIHDDAWADIAEAVAGAANIERCIGWSDTLPASAYDRLIAEWPRRMGGGAHDEEVVTHILYTSGTTGLPKGALCSQGTLKHHALNLARVSRLAESDVHHLNIVPLFHAGGLNSFSNPALYWGGHVTTIRRFDPGVVIDLLSDPEVAITHLCGVLQMYELITAHPGFGEAHFPTLRTALFGGWGPKTVPVHEAWRARGFFLQLSYGATELGPIVSVLEDGADLASMNCSGAVVAGTEVRLVDAAGVDVADGQVGEIWARGPAVTPGYWRRPGDDYFTGDWFRTGDCARRDEAGRLFIVDRLREVYRSGGENIYPAEIEQALSDVPGVKEIAVIAVPDERWGEVGLAVVELTPGANVTLEILHAHSIDRISRFKWPRHLVTIAEMPRSATLKIDRAALKKAYGGSAAV
jgi:fatty-acyl-CoA synthase